MELIMPDINFAAIMPELVLSVVAMALLLVNVFIKSEQKWYLGVLSLLGIGYSAYTGYLCWGMSFTGFNGAVIQDNFSLFFKGIFLLCAALTVLISDYYFKREECNHGELYPMILFATAGMMLMASGSDLMTIFLGLELLSVSLYILAGFNRKNVKSNEAGLKYFLLGAFSTGFLLYGMALIFGATGSVRLDKIASAALRPEVHGNTLFLVGMILMAVGFSFKIAAAPFHMWTPDVYEGAPTPITAFMSAGPKAAGFAAFIRVMLVAMPLLKYDWTSLIAILAVITMTVGNLIALNQDNIKRMLAYSSIAHAGYALVGFTAANQVGVAGILFYLLSYTFMNIGAFAIIILVGKKGDANNNVMDYAGLASRRPVLAAVMAIFLFSLAGIPPFAGFMGKFYLFGGAIQAGYLWLAIIGVLNSAASVYYYLRVMVYMYMKEPEQDFAWAKTTPAIFVALSIALAGVVIPGLLPQSLLSLAQQALTLPF
jgi:NADH-quinone oxidoreductase subunit N